MPVLHIVLDYERNGFDAYKRLQAEGRIPEGGLPTDIQGLIDLTGANADSAKAEITVIPKGTVAGNSTVILCLTLPDGKVLVWETTLALIDQAISGFKAIVPR